MPRNIVLCCDGTTNEIAGDQTNVLRLFRMLVRSPDQQVFYDAGVGTRADPTVFWPLRRMLRKKLDSAVGMSIRENVLAAYRFLSTHYELGDRIYLIGFSRGAYTVRALAGMIMRCGLLEKEFLHLAEYTWSVYSDEDRSDDGKRQFGGAARIKKVFGRKVTIHFVGVWDTVSSFGWIWDPLTLPNTANNKEIETIRHALAIDERRAYFQSNRFGNTVKQDRQEVWFAGGHADVGGGYPDKVAGLAKISLQWMLAEAKYAGLVIDDCAELEMLKNMGLKDCPAELSPLHDESGRFLWFMIGLLPKLGYSERWKRRLPSWPNWRRRRSIEENSLIHESVIVRRQRDRTYQPVFPVHFTAASNLTASQKAPTVTDDTH
jgi:uncharacterized protein (DUF2235 family)